MLVFLTTNCKSTWSCLKCNISKTLSVLKIPPVRLGLAVASVEWQPHDSVYGRLGCLLLFFVLLYSLVVPGLCSFLS